MVFETHIINNDSFGKYVDQLIYFKDYDPEHSFERIVPNGTTYLVIELDGKIRFEIDNHTLQKGSKRIEAWLSGMHNEFITISTVPQSEMFVIQFKANGLYPFLHQPISKLNNKIVHAEEVFGRGIRSLRVELLKTKTPNDKFLICNKWLSQRYSESHRPHTAVSLVCDQIKTYENIELNNVTSLISQTGLSKKHFIQLFKKYVGLIPKQYQRIVRFNGILSLIQENKKVEWTQIAYSCGYYDQSHFIKEFKLFCGINPSIFIKNYKEIDRNNFFPIE